MTCDGEVAAVTSNVGSTIFKNGLEMAPGAELWQSKAGLGDDATLSKNGLFGTTWNSQWSKSSSHLEPFSFYMLLFSVLPGVNG